MHSYYYKNKLPEFNYEELVKYWQLKLNLPDRYFDSMEISTVLKVVESAILVNKVGIVLDTI